MQLVYIVIGVLVGIAGIATLLTSSGAAEVMSDEDALPLSNERRQMLIAAERDQDFDLGFRGE